MMRTAICLALWLLPVLSGCARFDLRKNIPWGAGKDGELEPPMRVSALWTDTVYTMAGLVPQRGFGGRLLFYATEGGKPVKVDGTVVVYAYDETHRDPLNIVPDRKYVFPPDEVAKRYSKTKLGHSYSFWLPWDNVGGKQTEISLIVRFTPVNGGAVVGELARHILPGLPQSAGDKHPLTQATRQNGLRGAPEFAEQPAAYTAMAGQAVDDRPQVDPYVQPAGGVAPAELDAAAPWESNAGADEANPLERRMTTTTISIPQGFGRRAPSALVRPRSSPGVEAAEGNAPHSSEAAAAPDAAAPAARTTRFGPQRARPLGAPLTRINRDQGPWRFKAGPRPPAAEAASNSAQ